MTAQSDTMLWTPGRKSALALGAVAWLTVAAWIGASEMLANGGDQIIAPIAFTAIVPVAAFLAFYMAAPGFRRFVLAQDIATLTMLQHWRVIGFAFLPLMFFGVLPGLFAWPAGLGDVAIGLAALLVVMRMRQHPVPAATPGLVRFHLLGLLDFTVAIVTANLASGARPELVSGGVTSAPMSVWPLNLFPSFLVPAFIILHLAVLLQVWEWRGRSAATQAA